MESALVIGLVVALVIGVGVLVWWLGKKRREAMAAIAQGLKLTFYPKGDASLTPLLAPLEFFSYGRYQRVRNLMKGRMRRSGQELTIAIFDYYYTVGRGDKADTFMQTVLLFYDESLHAPSYTLRPEHLLDKLGNVFGYTDINFTEFPTFSRKYRLQGESEQEVRSLFQPNVVRFYEKQKICTEAKGASVIIFPSDDLTPRSGSIRMQGSKTLTKSRLIHPNEVKNFLEVGFQLIDLLRRNEA